MSWISGDVSKQIIKKLGCGRNVVSEINVANTHDSKGNSKQLCGKEQ